MRRRRFGFCHGTGSPLIEFPDPRSADPDGIVAIGGDMSPDMLASAYAQGIFPWPISGVPVLTWFCPAKRGIIKLSQVHIPRSLQKLRKKNPFTFTVDQCFEKIISACSEVPRGDPISDTAGSWITPTLKKAYIEFHKKGHELGRAHSIEVWNGKELVGGVYGVEVLGVFSAESMFYKESGASKLGLLFLFDYLKSKGCEWVDIQVISKHMKALGATEITRNRFLTLLKDTQARGLKLFL